MNLDNNNVKETRKHLSFVFILPLLEFYYQNIYSHRMRVFIKLQQISMSNNTKGVSSEHTEFCLLSAPSMPFHSMYLHFLYYVSGLALLCLLWGWIHKYSIKDICHIVFQEHYLCYISINVFLRAGFGEELFIFRHLPKLIRLYAFIKLHELLYYNGSLYDPSLT